MLTAIYVIFMDNIDISYQRVSYFAYFVSLGAFAFAISLLTIYARYMPSPMFRKLNEHMEYRVVLGLKLAKTSPNAAASIMLTTPEIPLKGNSSVATLSPKI